MSDDMIGALVVIFAVIMVVVVLFAIGGMDIIVDTIADAFEAWHDAVQTPTPTP